MGASASGSISCVSRRWPEHCRRRVAGAEARRPCPTNIDPGGARASGVSAAQGCVRRHVSRVRRREPGSACGSRRCCRCCAKTGSTAWRLSMPLERLKFLSERIIGSSAIRNGAEAIRDSSPVRRLRVAGNFPAGRPRGANRTTAHEPIGQRDQREPHSAAQPITPSYVPTNSPYSACGRRARGLAKHGDRATPAACRPMQPAIAPVRKRTSASSTPSMRAARRTNR